MKEFDFLAAAGLVFFVSIPLIVAVSSFGSGLKRDIAPLNRVLLAVLGLVALSFAYWVSFRKGEWVCEDAVSLLLTRGLLFVMLLPTAYFIEKAYQVVWQQSKKARTQWSTIAKALITFVVFEAIGVGVYALWLRFIA